MNRSSLIRLIKDLGSLVCVGLDPDIEKIPARYLAMEDPFFSFCKDIIDDTCHVAIAYKANTAFFEVLGPQGWVSFQKVADYVKAKGRLFIADGKRADIGNTSRIYAQAFFKTYGADALTIAPYMGDDSVKPFLTYEGKWTIVLALTSNEGAQSFQFFHRGIAHNIKYLFEQVLIISKEWGTVENTMYVVGATKPEYFARVRKIVPDHFLLVPGVGAQGGDLDAVCEHGINSDGGLLINSSRGIIYAESPRLAAEEFQKQTEIALRKKGII